MNYQEAIRYIESIPLFQNIGDGGFKEGLYNSYALDEHLGHPHSYYPTIHIAGTNGKGSCAHTTAAILQSAGLSVGLYTSPHFKSFRERIRINGELIEAAFITNFIQRERTFCESLQPSFFELTTPLAFEYFKEQKVDIAVIEVGLGGRLDCTNVIHPLLSVITNISLDHTQYLGHTPALIAAEKAGIIKQDTPVIIGEATKETRPIFEEKAQQFHAPIVFAEDSQEVITSEPDFTSGGRIYHTHSLGTLYGELGGLCQEKNTNTLLHIVSALRQKGYAISNEAIRTGFGQVTELTGLKGRWQKVHEHPTVVCDTAHNEGGFAYISRQLTSQPCQHLRIIFGMVGDKDVAAVLKLLPNNAQYYFTRAQIKRAMPEDQLARLAQQFGLKGSTYPNVRAAFTQALQDASADDFIYVGGSSYIVTDFLSFE